MTKTIEVSGKTEDEAVELALEQLRLTRDDVSVEIVERAKTGFLGIKNTPAIVKVTYESSDEGQTERKAEGRPSSERKAESRSERKKEDRTERKSDTRAERKADTRAERKPEEYIEGKAEERIERVEDFLMGLFTRMDVEVGVKSSVVEGSIEVNLTGKDPGVLIGRRGETLDSIQHLTNYVINRGGAGRVRVNIDAENYRQRRNETLESLAARTAGKVMKYRRNMTLDPMNAYERHIIHAALESYENISTYSIGSEPNRRIVVAYSRDGDSGGSRGGSDFGERNDGGRQQFKEWS